VDSTACFLLFWIHRNDREVDRCWSITRISGFSLSICKADHKFYNSQGPLGWAAYGGHLQTCRLLVKYGADVAVKNVHGQTPFDLVRKPSSDWDFLKAPEKKKAETIGLEGAQIKSSEEIKISLRRSRPSSEVQPQDEHHSPALKIKLRGASPAPEVQIHNPVICGICCE
jgi:hypothetical protein